MARTSTLGLAGRALAVWGLVLAAESVHGAIRRAAIEPALGERRAHQVSVGTGSALILFIAHRTAGWLDARTRRERLGVGAAWAVLTLLFEIVLGRYGFRYTWTRIAADFDPRQGGLMGVGLLSLLLAPLLTGREGAT